MLLSFSIENFLSYRHETIFDFSAERSSFFPSHVITREKAKSPKATKFNVFFGPNGSGKSNFIIALDFCQHVVLQGIPPRSLAEFPFSLTNDPLNPIGAFSFRISPWSSSETLTYTFKIDYFAKKVIYERFQYGERTAFLMECSSSDSPIISNVRFFQRKADRTQFDRYVSDFCSKKAPRKTFLNYLLDEKQYDKDSEILQLFSPMYTFFENLIILSPNPKYKTFITLLSNKQIQSQIEAEIKKFDVGVSSICLQDISEKDFLVKAQIDEKDTDAFLAEIKERADKNHIVSFTFGGNLFFGQFRQGGGIRFSEVVLLYEGLKKPHDFSMESDGTRKLINMIPLLLNKENSTIVIDEVDRSFHTELTNRFIKELIRIFSEPKSEAQILMTAHDVQLFSLSVFRPDEIFLLERNHTDYSTKIQRLSSLRIRHDRTILKYYFNGTYGSTPRV
jgi:hypothetical protein